jgi:hypothetical protein
MSSKHRNKHTICPNCGTQVGEQNFCPECGQENHDLNIPFGHLILEVLENTLHLDTKLWHSLKAVFTKPGLITKEFVEGKRARHIPPFRMYVFIAVVFFFVVTVFTEKTIKETEKVSEKNVEAKVLIPKVNDISNRIKVLPKTQQVKYKSIVDSSLLHLKNTRLPVRTREKMNESLETAEKSFSDLVETDSTNLAFSQLPDSSRTQYIVVLDTLKQQFNDLWLSESKEDILAQPELYHVSTRIDGGFSKNQDGEVALNRAELEEVCEMKGAELDKFLAEKKLNFSFAQKAIFRHNAKMMALPESERIHQLIKYASLAMLFLMPLFAFMLELWFRARPAYYYEHFIFSVHFHSVLFIFLILTWLWIWCADWIGLSEATKQSVLTWGIRGIVFYMYLAIRNVYPPKERKTRGWLLLVWEQLGLENVYQKVRAMVNEHSGRVQKMGFWCFDLVKRIVRNIRLKEFWYITKVFWLIFWYVLLGILGYLGTIYLNALMS